MSVKIHSIHVPDGKMPLCGVKPWMFIAPYSMYFDATIDGVLGSLHVNYNVGYELDFASTFWPVSLLLPQFKGDPMYDSCAGAHDVGYGLMGKVDGLDRSLSADEVDDIIRGGWRCSGIKRLPASTADLFLVFAHTRKHWGADQYGCRDRATMVWVPEEG